MPKVKFKQYADPKGRGEFHEYESGRKVLVRKPKESKNENPAAVPPPPALAMSPAKAKERARLKEAKAYDSNFAPGVGQQIRRSINADVDLQTRPTLNEYDRQLSKIRPQEQADAAQSKALYEQVAKNAQTSAAGVTGGANEFLTKLAASYGLKAGEDAARFKSAADEREQDLLAKRGEVVDKRGQLRTSLRTKAIEREQDNRLAEKAYGLEETKTLGELAVKQQQANNGATTAAAAKTRAGAAVIAAKNKGKGAGKNGPGTASSPYLSKKDQAKALAPYGSLKTIAAAAKKGGKSRQEIVQLLTAPDAGETKTVTNPDGSTTATKSPPLPKVPEPVISALLDELFNPDGALSSTTVQRLKQAGIQVANIPGARTRRQVGPPKEKPKPKVKKPKKNLAQQIIF